MATIHHALCLFTLLALLVSISPANGYRWLRQEKRPSLGSEGPYVSDDLYQPSHAAEDSILLTDEQQALQRGTDVLDAYERKPSCYKNAARILRQGCKSLDIDENEKIKYAIRLTVCEITTAHMPVPADCLRLVSFSDRKEQSSEEIVGCVHALGQVSQHWTSYSGNLREVKVMCLAVQYSLEREALYGLQKNLTQSHADQIAMLQEQRRFILETRQHEKARMEEILEMHSNIAKEAGHLMSSASALRDSLGSLYDDISKLTRQATQGAAEQSVALSDIHDMNEQLFIDHQKNIQETVGSIAQSLQQWKLDLEQGLTRTREIGWQGDQFLAKIKHSKYGLDLVASHISTAEERLQAMNDRAAEGNRALLDLHNTGVEAINTSTRQVLENMLQTLDALESDSQIAWQAMTESIKMGSTRFQDEVSSVFAATVSDIGSMATESQERIEKLNDLVQEFHSKQENVFRPLHVLYRTWRLWRGTSTANPVVAFALGISVLVFYAFLFGTSGAIIMATMSAIASMGCYQWSIPLSFTQILGVFFILQICSSLRRLRASPNSLSGNKRYDGCLYHNDMAGYEVDDDEGVWEEDEDYDDPEDRILTQRMVQRALGIQQLCIDSGDIFTSLSGSPEDEVVPCSGPVLGSCIYYHEH